MFMFTHKNCGGKIESCPVYEEPYCDRCEQFIDHEDVIQANAVKLMEEQISC